MANVVDPTPEQQQDWEQWVEGRPASVRAVLENLKPWKHDAATRSLKRKPEGDA